MFCREREGLAGENTRLRHRSFSFFSCVSLILCKPGWLSLRSTLESCKPDSRVWGTGEHKCILLFFSLQVNCVFTFISFRQLHLSYTPWKLVHKCVCSPVLGSILLPTSLSSLARTLDSGLASTLAQLEGLGETDRCSTATSGVSKWGHKNKN